MANNPRLQVDIGANIEAFQKAMGTVSTRLNSLSADIGKIGKQLSVGLTAPITAFGAASVAAFDTQAQAEARLRAALQANGRAVNELFSDYASFASQLQQISTVGDEATLAMLGTAESMGISGESAKRAVQNALAMESAFGVSAQSAIRMTAALEQGDAQLLTRYIPALRQTEDAAERVQIAQDLLGKAFGTVTAQAQTGLGPLTQAKNAFGDLQEQIGAIISEAINPFLIKAKELFETLQQGSEESKRRIVLLSTAAAAAGPVLLALSLAIKGVATALTILRTATLLMSTAVFKLMAALAPVIGTIAAVVGIVTTLFLTMNYLSKNVDAFKALFVNAWKRIKNVVIDAVSNISAGLGELIAKIPGFGDLADSFTEVSERVKENAEVIDEDGAPAFMSMSEFAQSLGNDVNALGSRLKSATLDLLGFNKAAQATASATDRDFGQGIGRSEQTVPSLVPMGKPPELQRAEAVEGGLQKIREAILRADEAGKQYVSGMVDGFSQMVVQGQKFGDILKNIGRQLLSKGLSTVIKALLVGTTGPLAILGGAGGTGILGKILPKVFGGAAAAPVMGASPVMDRGMMLKGEFRLDGQDLKLAVDRANQIANI